MIGIRIEIYVENRYRDRIIRVNDKENRESLLEIIGECKFIIRESILGVEMGYILVEFLRKSKVF
jgi:hypothetical protein